MRAALIKPLIVLLAIAVVMLLADFITPAT